MTIVLGQLRGVRGFNDPRAIDLPNGNPVWLQSNQAGETYAPFHLNIKDTKATLDEFIAALLGKSGKCTQ
ncbi:MAG: hypothetical protein WDM78_10040 [Puia sp.]